MANLVRPESYNALKTDFKDYALYSLSGHETYLECLATPKTFDKEGVPVLKQFYRDEILVDVDLADFSTENLLFLFCNGGDEDKNLYCYFQIKPFWYSVIGENHSVPDDNFSLCEDKQVEELLFTCIEEGTLLEKKGELYFTDTRTRILKNRFNITESDLSAIRAEFPNSDIKLCHLFLQIKVADKLFPYMKENIEKFLWKSSIDDNQARKDRAQGYNEELIKAIDIYLNATTFEEKFNPNGMDIMPTGSAYGFNAYGCHFENWGDDAFRPDKKLETYNAWEYVKDIYEAGDAEFKNILEYYMRNTSFE